VNKYLADTPAIVRFASAEPLMDDLAKLQMDKLDWLIVGGEDLPPDQDGWRPLHPDWAQSLRQRSADDGAVLIAVPGSGTTWPR